MQTSEGIGRIEPPYEFSSREPIVPEGHEHYQAQRQLLSHRLGVPGW